MEQAFSPAPSSCQALFIILLGFFSQGSDAGEFDAGKEFEGRSSSGRDVTDLIAQARRFYRLLRVSSANY